MIDIAKLENVKEQSDKWIAACPACKTDKGMDSKGMHLCIYKSNMNFGCCAFPEDKEHKKRILELVGSGKLDYTNVYQDDNKIKQDIIYPEDVLSRLLPMYEYFETRGITKDTQKLFKVGFAMSGTCRKRYVAPIYNQKMQIHGFWGRWFQQDSGDKPKYKLVGRKTTFIWPWHLTEKFVKESGEVILVESPADVLWLYQHGIQNVLCLFGVTLSSKLLNYLVSLNLKRIIIATNNEPHNNNIGNEAAIKIKDKLLSFYDKDKVVIKLPMKKDFCEMSETELKQWQL